MPILRSKWRPLNVAETKQKHKQPGDPAEFAHMPALENEAF
jgi:hypothetical protein